MSNSSCTSYLELLYFFLMPGPTCHRSKKKSNTLLQVAVCTSPRARGLHPTRYLDGIAADDLREQEPLVHHAGVPLHGDMRVRRSPAPCCCGTDGAMACTG